MKPSLARLTKWFLVLVGIVVCLCFETLVFFQNESTYNCPSYVGLAIGVAHFLCAFFLFLFLVAILVFLMFLFLKISLPRLKKWKPVRVGIFVGFGLWVLDTILRLTNENALSFYVRPYVWLAQILLPLVKPPGQPPAHPIIFLIAVFLGLFIYYAVLGALLGFSFQLLLWVFRKLKRHNTACQTKA